MTRRGRREPRALRDLVGTVLGDLDLDRGSEIGAIAARWDHIVGPRAAAHARPTLLRGGVLEATVDSSAWCQELTLRRSELLRALRQELGDRAPTELWFRVGGPAAAGRSG